MCAFCVCVCVICAGWILCRECIRPPAYTHTHTHMRSEEEEKQVDLGVGWVGGRISSASYGSPNKKEGGELRTSANYGPVKGSQSSSLLQRMEQHRRCFVSSLSPLLPFFLIWKKVVVVVGSFSWATTRQHFFFFLHFCMCAVRSSTHSLSSERLPLSS